MSPPSLIAAAALFFLPSLLGIGGGSPGGAASPSPSQAASAAPAASVVPTAAAEATPQVYLVQAGDTMSKIANKFHVPLADPDRREPGAPSRTRTS